MPGGRTCWRNWRTAMAYRSMDWFRGPVRGGITGGITRGAAYLWIVVGSKLPPGMAAQARPTASQGTSKPAPPTAPAFSNCRLGTIAHPPSQRPTPAVGLLTGQLASRPADSGPYPRSRPYRARVLRSRSRHGGSQAVRQGSRILFSQWNLYRPCDSRDNPQTP